MEWMRYSVLLWLLCAFQPHQVCPDKRGLRRITYVLHSGKSHPAAGGSTFGTRHGVFSSSSSSTYTVRAQGSAPVLEVKTSYRRNSPQVRTRRMGKASSRVQQQQHIAQFHPHQYYQQQSIRHPVQYQKQQLRGVNVCSGQCCHGWAQAPGSQRCTKPNCSPQCQNGGMCLRPQLCVCKPGTKGKACEEMTSSTHSTNNQNTVAQAQPIPQRMPQQTLTQRLVQLPQKISSLGHMSLAVKQKPSMMIPQQSHLMPLQSQPLMMLVQRGQTQQFTFKPKYYNQKFYPGGQAAEGSLPQTPSGPSFRVGNHTGRIKVVFTPTICKVTCTKGKCHNSCHQGNTTTLISENGHAADTLTAQNFRVVVCHLPCMNGGQCTSRNKCQCSPNFTGKLCHIPVQPSNGRRQQYQQPGKAPASPVVHSTHTLPLSVGGKPGLQMKFPPNLVNIHVKHPPEANVQIHQVSRVDSSSLGQKVNGVKTNQQQISYRVPNPSISHIPNSVYTHHQQVRTRHYPITQTKLGRCFQETAGAQCGKPLPGLSKQEDCCGTVGTSWGFHKCQKCPKKPSFPIRGNGQMVECPLGYKQVNATHCQVATSMPEQELEKEKHVVESGLPQLSPSITTIQINSGFPGVVEKTSPPSPVHIAPDVSTSSLTHFIASTQVAEIDECSVNPRICGPGQCINLPEGYTCNCDPGYQLNAVNTECTDVDECAQAPRPCSNGHCKNTVGSFRCFCHRGFTSDGGTQCSDIDECLRPNVCGEGHCINLVGSYRCQYCDPGHRMNRGQCEDIDECQDSNKCPSGRCINNPGSYECVSCPDGYTGRNGLCIDINECLNRSVCANGRCSNLDGTYICTCNRGYEPTPNGKVCKDVDECQDAILCSNGQCSNTEASFYCDCNAGYRLAATGDQCEDIDECQERADVCRGGACSNNAGSFTCTCSDGFQLVDGVRCQDVNECLTPELCTHGDCLNTEGSFYCICDKGFTVSSDGRKCEDVDECTNDTVCGSHGFCENTAGAFQCLCDQGFQDLLEGKGCEDVNECEMINGVCGEALCENVEGSFLCICPDDIQEFDPMTGECRSPEPPGWGDNCEVFPCPVFGTPEFAALCPEGKGLIPNGDSAFGISGHNYKDADECVLFGQEICKNGFCLNTQPGYECYCRQGLYYDPVKLQCLDIDECQDAASCINGQCINTEGSYNCFCTHPLVLDASGKRCTQHLDSDGMFPLRD
ncbi:hypothetical protein scyTo_0007284 [Scyliorhinus torazame]|uniref:Latent-transforming growth factor beta-binding protein 1 n=1 Tax=Scyliorhinus torazame TaxID=75743 RepID=A0A401NPJ6_SCYTO|nr:hypothetical protein [Scyliorhinus torazame]